MDPLAIFGPIDIYLFDQILRGRIHPGGHLADPLKTTIVQNQRCMIPDMARAKYDRIVNVPSGA